MTLTAYGKQPSSVFRLIGVDENSATSALGWVLEQSPQFLSVFVESVFGEPLPLSGATVALQKHDLDGGYTDLEIQASRSFHLILEAKRLWNVPRVAQLSRYLPRLVGCTAARKQLVSVSMADQMYALRRLPNELDGVGITHLSWGDLRRLAERARSLASRNAEKLWLAQLIEHLGEFVSMTRQSDNNVFVVSLGRKPMVLGKDHTWIDVVEKDGCYFHPVGNGWPVEPPNYVGFRYYGKLQSVHHVDGSEVVDNVATVNPRWLTTEIDHFVYRLGPPMRPSREVRTGKIFRNGRVWCAIDTLLSGAFATVSDARDETRRRLAEVL